MGGGGIQAMASNPKANHWGANNLLDPFPDPAKVGPLEDKSVPHTTGQIRALQDESGLYRMNQGPLNRSGPRWMYQGPTARISILQDHSGPS